MNRKIKIIANSLLAFIVALLLVNCTPHPQLMVLNRTNSNSQTRTFRSNGERIYFSSTSDRNKNITYTGGQSSGGMMGNGSSGGMMGNNNMTCASCHGADGRGGVQTMMGMQTIKVPDIRWSALKDEFDTEKFRLAITKGQDPDGKKQLNNYMPRWNIGNEDIADLIGFLKTLP
ncbi:cytochrome c [Nodularia harveyana UHCC-0300]|uniref:Cytochrome c n=1 Tax=Nodularia harveyana UHCC-0300 TaxID=2974287 RepID=A0ABU5U9I0_9CYAN|nr:cytochrome c [Nodularia harveyana]MEA5580190.1 cytochrome c [Nodularia harveyana UHCC-0300]